jgi:outer membrane protein assembly factor BamB
MSSQMLKNKFKNTKIIAAFILSTSFLTACGTFFEKDNNPTPTPLTSFKPETTPRLAWSAQVGAGSSSSDYLKMSPAVSETAIYTASTSGTITSLNLATGRRNWQTYVRMPLSSGPGVGDGIVVVGCQKGNLVALNESDGREIWRASVHGEVIAAPAIGGGVVVVKTIDGYTRAFSTQNGQETWSYQQLEPNLILRGASRPIIRDQAVIVGYANGNLAKFGLNGGQLLWQETVAVPQGAFAIERMIDIDADPIVFQHHIYVATYQGRISSLDWTSGRALWTYDISSYTGMAADDNAVYISDAKGMVWAFDADNGLVNWRQKKLEYRIISGPASMYNYIVVGDGEGYLHWLSKTDGHFAARVSLGSAIYASPVVKNNVLYALTNSGYLAAYTLR